MHKQNTLHEKTSFPQRMSVEQDDQSNNIIGKGIVNTTNKYT